MRVITQLEAASLLPPMAKISIPWLVNPKANVTGGLGGGLPASLGRGTEASGGGGGELRKSLLQRFHVLAESLEHLRLGRELRFEGLHLCFGTLTPLGSAVPQGGDLAHQLRRVLNPLSRGKPRVQCSLERPDSRARRAKR